MDICIYGNYKIEINVKQSVCVGFDEFEKYEENYVITRNGTELIEILKNHFEDSWFQNITFEKDKIEISYFNPMNGEGSDYVLNITPIEEDLVEKVEE